MVISFCGSSRPVVEERIQLFLDGFGNKRSFDYIIDVRKSSDNWRGTLVMLFHVK